MICCFCCCFKWKNTKNEDIMILILKCNFEKGNSDDAFKKVWLQINRLT